MKILAIDYGTVRVGLAVSYGSLAEPLAVVAHDAKLVERIKELGEEHGVEEVVVGLSENKMADQILQWVEEELRPGIPWQIVLVDETLSSHTAGELRKGKTLTERKKPVDDVAAAVFLQEYLDSQPKED